MAAMSEKSNLMFQTGSLDGMTRTALAYGYSLVQSIARSLNPYAGRKSAIRSAEANHPAPPEALSPAERYTMDKELRNNIFRQNIKKIDSMSAEIIQIVNQEEFHQASYDSRIIDLLQQARNLLDAGISRRGLT
jgi:hypothetical protein